MNSFFTSFIAIILLAVVAIAGLTFIDVDETQASARAPSVASSLSNLVESSAFFNESRGNYPLSFEDMQSEFDGLTAEGVDGQYFISNNIGCIGLDYTENNELTLQAAKLRLSGSVVSNSCGELESNGRRYLAISLDGQSLPVGDAFLASLTPEGIANAPPPAPPLERGQLPVTDLSQVCGVEPPLSANNTEKGLYISCYLTDFNQRARAWFLAGRGLTPDANELFREGFISHPPPAYPELAVITVTGNPRFLGLLRTPSPTPYGSVAFFNGNGTSAAGVSGRDLSVRTASNSSEQTQSLLSGAHVYMPPFIFSNQFDQVDLTPYEPEGGVPDANSSILEQGQYIAYWLSLNNQSARAWIASGNAPASGSFNFAQFQASGFPTLAPLNIGNSRLNLTPPTFFDRDRRSFFSHRIFFRAANARAICDVVDEYSYRQAFCGPNRSDFQNRIFYN